MACCGVLWIGFWFGAALPAAEVVPVVDDVSELASERRVLSALRTWVNSDWQLTPLKEIVAEIQRATGIPVIIDGQSFKRENRDPNPKLTCALGSVTALTALQRLDVRWHIEHGQVVVCSPGVELPYLVRHYDISRLKRWLVEGGVDQLAPTENRHLIKPPMAIGPPVASPPWSDLNPNRSEHAEQLISGIIQWSSSHNWLNQGGRGGSIQHRQDFMVVTQTFPAQMEVAASLEFLQQLADGSAVRQFRNWDASIPEEARLEVALGKSISVEVDGLSLQDALALVTSRAAIRCEVDRDVVDQNVLDQRVAVHYKTATVRSLIQELVTPFELEPISISGVVHIVPKNRCDPSYKLVGYRIEDVPVAFDRRSFLRLIQAQTSNKWFDLDQEGATVTWLGPQVMLISAPLQCHLQIQQILSRFRSSPAIGFQMLPVLAWTGLAHHIVYALGWILFAVWAVAAGLPTIWFIGRSLRQRSDSVPEPAEWPLVTVVVPARDEGHKIEAGLRSLIAADYPHFEIIAINDRSRDDTGAIMDQLAVEAAAGGGESRLRVVHVTSLPEGWLGKNHALQLGSQQARGEWILFTDGDVIHSPDTLRRTLRYALARNLDHLPLLPNIEAHSVFEAAFVACFALVFTAGTQPGLVPSKFPWFYVGVGAFNLVRRSAFERAGGFEPIRLDILDDVKLGKLLKRTGGRSEVLRAADGLNIRWQQSAWLCITGLEKNAFASANYSVPQLLWTTGVAGLVFVGPLLGTLFAGDARAGYVAALVLSHLIYGFSSRLFGHSFWVFPFLVPSGLAFLFAFLRSTWITLRQGGVRWRDTFYPLKTLREHVYR